MCQNVVLQLDSLENAGFTGRLGLIISMCLTFIVDFDHHYYHDHHFICSYDKK